MIFWDLGGLEPPRPSAASAPDSGTAPAETWSKARSLASVLCIDCLHQIAPIALLYHVVRLISV